MHVKINSRNHWLFFIKNVNNLDPKIIFFLHQNQNNNKSCSYLRNFRVSIWK